MAEGQDKDQKTEEPTAKKLSEAKKKGDIPKSQEINTWFIMVAAAFSLVFLAGPAARMLAEYGHGHFETLAQQSLGAGEAMALMRGVLKKILAMTAGLAALLFVAAALGNLVQTGLVFSAEKMKPKLNKLSPIAGFGRLFGIEGAVNLGKGIAKMAIVGAVLFFVIWPDRRELALIPYWDVSKILPFALKEALKMLFAMLAVLTVIAALDYAYQKYQHHKKQKMTKQEVKDEHKQSDGDPAVKAKIRQVRQERSKQRMMAAVPDASVVVTNPTHYAVALKYEMGQAGAPTCVAKGVDALALRIRDVAKENKVPVVENPPLARALFAAVDVDEEVPVEHYKAVAKIIGFIMRKGKKPKR